MSPRGVPRRARGALVGAVATCVFLSGTASLALEVTWSRLLKLVFGSTTLAITTILVAYMLGLGLGGLLGGRLARRVRNGVRAYGLLEAGIGLYALAVPWVLGLYPAVHRAIAELGFWPAAFVRFALVSLLLLGPTLAMGATLPLLVESLVRERSALAGRVGLLYGANTLGAVAGVLGATFLGFWFLGVHGTNTAAALLDVAVGLAALRWLAPRAAASDAVASGGGQAAGSSALATPAPAPPSRLGPRAVVLSYGIVGGTALAYEVAWTRGLAMVLGSSAYAFATILAGFLAGIALGSLLLRRGVERLARPLEAYGLGLVALGLAALAVGWGFRALPELFLALFAHVGISGAVLVWLGLGFAFCVMLLPTVLLGALFPLVTRLAAEHAPAGRGRFGGAVGAVYFANTVGSALGAFLAGFVVIPRFGLPATLAVAIALDLATGAFLLLRGAPGRLAPWKVAAPALALFVLVRPPAWDAGAFATGVYYRTSAQLELGLPRRPLLAMDGTERERDELLFYREGVNCTVSVHRMAEGLAEGLIGLRVNGKTDASLADMPTQVLSGHLPFLFGGPAERVLVIGYASGITAGVATLHAPRVDVCEIEDAVVEASRWFDDYNHRPLQKEGVRLIVDDGRSYLAGDDTLYDVIVSEPSNPWITGCANLFTSEFFAIARDSLAPGGRLLQWIQLYGMSPEGLRSVLAALHENFEHASGFLFDAYSKDLLLIASDRPLDPADFPRLEALPEEVRDDLARVGVRSSADLWSLYRLSSDDVAALAAGASHENTDDSMYVELAAPWALYDDTEETLRLVRASGGGLPALLAAAGPGSPAARGFSDEDLGELAVRYLVDQGEPELAAAARELLEARGARGMTALCDALVETWGGGADPAHLQALLDEAVAKAPRAFVARLERGRFENELGRHEEALADLEAALALRPGDLEARHERMRALASLQRMKPAYDEAAALLESPLAAAEPRLWAEAAYLSGGFGRFDEALERMRHYLELEPDSPDEWELLARWYELSERPGAARHASENAERARANEVRDMHWIARWHERFGTLREARLALEEVLRLDPGNAAAHADLARLRAGDAPEGAPAR